MCGLSAAELAAVRSVGLDPVGQVMGSTVHRVAYGGGGGCGVYRWSGTGQRSYAPRVAGTGGTSSNRWVGYGDLVSALYAARRRAVARLVQECTAVGGDGVVGVRLRIRHLPGSRDVQEFSAVGTAVRSRGRVHPPRPFLSDLSGQDVAVLLRAGWVPCGLAFGVAVGVRHDDLGTRGAVRSWRNGEVPGYTEVVQQTRAQVRAQVREDVARQGGQGLVVRDMTLEVREQECLQVHGQRDHVAQATLVGTALVPFARSAAPPDAPLQVLRLDELHSAVVGPRLTDHEEEFR